MFLITAAVTSTWAPGAFTYALGGLGTGRILYGIWRGWQAWGAVTGDRTWIAEAGVAGSMGVGAILLGYYFTYWLAIRWRLARV